MTPDNEQYKREVRQWSTAQLAIFKRNIRTLTNKEKHVLIKAINVKGIKRGQSSRLAPQHLVDSLNAKVLNRFNTPERVIFPFLQHGFYIAVGASKGHHYKNNPRAIIDWYDTALDGGMPILANIVAKHDANNIVKSTDFGALKDK
jgi:hypothetical protein